MEYSQIAHKLEALNKYLNNLMHDKRNNSLGLPDSSLQLFGKKIVS